MNHSGNHGKFPWEIFSFWIQLDLHPELAGWEEFKQSDICQLCLHFKWSKTRYQMLCNRNIQTLNKTCSVFLGNRHIECRVDTQTIVNLSETLVSWWISPHSYNWESAPGQSHFWRPILYLAGCDFSAAYAESIYCSSCNQKNLPIKKPKSI